MKQYPDVYYKLNELEDLSVYDMKWFKDRLIRVCEMYSIPIEEFKIYPDEKDSGYLFTPNVAEFVLILVKNIDKHPLYARNAKVENITATSVADFFSGILEDVDNSVSEQVKKILYCRDSHHAAQRTSDWAERLSKHLTRFIVNIATLRTEDVGEALRYFTKRLDQMNHALFMSNSFKRDVIHANEEEFYGETIPSEKQKILDALNDPNVGLDISIAALIKLGITDSKEIRKEGYLSTKNRIRTIQALQKMMGYREQYIDDILDKLETCNSTEEEREIYREYFLSSDGVDLSYPQRKAVAEYCKKHDDSWKSLDNQGIPPKDLDTMHKDELLQRYAEIRNQLIEVERKQDELHSQMREIEIALSDEGYSEYCASIDKKYQGLEDVTNHFIGQALNEFLKRDE